ncbi:MAG: hypothetical protein HY913_06285 [Desulfomonile tiedjei]|nr:hypothetical protein [Desulfomonile tiedjei]
MSLPVSSDRVCAICGDNEATLPKDEAALCGTCNEKSEILFDREMRKVELLRTIRGLDVELYDIKHPDALEEKNHCGQVIIMKAGQGFEVKICLRAAVLDWMQPLSDEGTAFSSLDARLDALIGNISLLIESWGGGPYYMDIFYVDRVVSTEGEV